MKNAIIRISISLLMALLFFAGSGNFQNAAAQEQERGISLHAVYTHVVVPLEESDVQFTVTLANNGKTGEGIQLQVTSAPDGWNYQFRSIYPENTIRAIYLTPAEEDPDKASQDVRFIVALPPNEVPGDYVFIVKAVTTDGAIEESLPLTVSLTREIVSVETEEVQLTPEAIVEREEVGNDFEFVVHVNNETEKDLTFDLYADVPPEWMVYMTYGWREDRINNLLVQAGATEDVRLVVTPSPYQEPGIYPREYPVTFTVKSGVFEDSVDLRAVITATYELIFTTPSDRPQLNTTATAGKPTHLSLLIYNNGSAPLEDISFTSVAPDGWTITFTPDKLDSLDAGNSREIDAAIEPGVKTIAGDYATVLKVNSKQDADSLDFRVTVETPTAWGWVGIIIAVLVIAALLGTFVMLRRR